MPRRSSRISRFLRNLAFGFRRELRPYEREVLEAAIGLASAEDARCLRLQLEARERVQRWNGDRMLMFGFPPGDDLDLIASRAGNHCFARVKLRGGDATVMVKLMTHRGRLSTLEFSKPPRAMLSAGHQILSAKRADGDTGFAEHIDAEEHGNVGDA